MKGFKLLFVFLLVLGSVGCSQAVSQQSFADLKQQVKNLQKENQNLKANVKQLNETVQSLRDRVSSSDSSNPDAQNGKQTNLPDDFIKVTKKDEVKKALPDIISSAFANDPKTKKWEMKRLAPLPQVDTYYQMGINAQGKALADLSWFVEVHFPAYEPSASLSTYQLFIAKSKSKGWLVWYKY